MDGPVLNNIFRAFKLPKDRISDSCIFFCRLLIESKITQNIPNSEKIAEIKKPYALSDMLAITPAVKGEQTLMN
ncbi:hypothetical protein EMIT0P171_120161 [Pseudomonas sp. IT-P171]